MNRQQFEIFAASVNEPIKARALKVTADPEVAADLAQDTLLKLWTLRDQLDNYQSPQALAMVIVNNLAISHLRQKQRRNNTDIETIGDNIIDSSDDQAEIESTVNYLLSQLPESQQQILRMRHIDGLELDEMAKILHTTNGAIRTALSRARRAAASLFNVSPL